MKSSIVDTTNRRKSSISKDEINEAQIGGAGRTRMFHHVPKVDFF